jgi:hypothetical protein
MKAKLGSIFLVGGILAAAACSWRVRSAALLGVEQRISAPEARQGAASDGRFVYAIDNSRVGKYAISSGARVASWARDAKRFPHLNSCTIVDEELVCAASNYPAFPPANRVEFFDASRLVHLRSVSLNVASGWLTAMDRHGGQWWGVFANYDRPGQSGQDHRSTQLMRMDDRFGVRHAWVFPASILKRLAPDSVSGASWTADGRLTLTGHRRRELYVVDVPQRGAVLKHVATVPVATPGQAIDWDARDPELLWSVDRKRRQVVSSRPQL